MFKQNRDLSEANRKTKLNEGKLFLCKIVSVKFQYDLTYSMIFFTKMKYPYLIKLIIIDIVAYFILKELKLFIVLNE